MSFLDYWIKSAPTTCTNDAFCWKNMSEWVDRRSCITYVLKIWLNPNLKKKEGKEEEGKQIKLQF